MHQGTAQVYIDDILFMSNSKPHLLQLVEQLRFIAIKKLLKLAREKLFLMLVCVNCLGQEIVSSTIKPIQSKKTGIPIFFSNYKK